MPNIIQYFQILSGTHNIVEIANLALPCLSCHIVRNIQILDNVVKYCQIFLRINWYWYWYINIVQWSPLWLLLGITQLQFSHFKSMRDQVQLVNISTHGALVAIFVNIVIFLLFQVAFEYNKKNSWSTWWIVQL